MFIAEATKHLGEAHLAKALAQAGNPIFIVDKLARLVWCNRAYALSVGAMPAELIGKVPLALQSSKDSAGFFLKLWSIVTAGEVWTGELKKLESDGELGYVEVIITPLTDASSGKPSLFLVFEHDITKHKKAAKNLWYQANHDRLTGLANRGLFASLLDHTLIHCKRDKTKAALLFIDLDGFKSVNDTYGHDAGDLVLVRVAQIIKQHTREADVVARFGGDEFACLLTGIEGLHGASLVAQKIIDAVREPIYVNSGHANIGASIGIALYPDHGITCDDLRVKADEAMYLAKSAGKNCWRDCSSFEESAVA